MFSIIYEMALYLFGLVSLPKMIFQMVKHGKYRKSFWKRLSFGKIELKKEANDLVIWMHAVSLGETKAIASLARLIHESNSQAKIVISSGTETGHEEAKRSITFAQHIFFPFDFRWSVKRVLKQINPDIIILCETDYWYNFLRFAKKMGTKLVVVNAKMSQKSLHRFGKVSFFSKKLFSFFDYICVQNSVYSTRFEKVGVPFSDIKVTGNLKFDEAVSRLNDQELRDFKEKLGIENQDIVLVIASTHAPEEEWLIAILQKLWKQFPSLKVILAPRHPERFSEVSHLLSDLQVDHVRFSELHENTSKKSSLILMDAMGQLRKCFQAGDVALVAGSFVDHVGGHNILEPCGYAMPVVFGPHMHSQRDFLDLALASGSGLQVTIENLEEILLGLFNSKERRQEIGSKGLQLIEENRGAAMKSFEAILPFLKAKS